MKRSFILSGRLDGLRFVPSDLDGKSDESWGVSSGLEIRGPAEALILAIAGRAVAIDDLSGDGVQILSERIRR